MTPVVEARDGAVTLGGRPILRGIDLTVAAGEVVAILGSNGSGKSTLVKSLLGLHPWTRGDVRLFDTPLKQFDEWHRVGYVPQRATAASGVPATVWEVVASGRLARRRVFRPLNQADRTAIHDAIEVVGMAHRRKDGVANLSGGQHQRVLIARALVSDPELFVLDEPTSGVDLASQDSFAETLRPFVAGGASIILVAHELGSMAPLIDRAVILRDGRKVYDGEPPASDGTAPSHHRELGPSHVHVPLEGRWWQ